MADIRIENVRKTYAGGVDAIRGVSLGIEDGEFCVLVGPSGCGKSTLLRMIAGLEHITEGTVAIGGRRVNELEPAERDIAMVFQNYALYPHMSVFDNMAYGLKNRGMAPAEIRRLVNEAAETLGLSDYLARKPRQLSGGQRQRVAMGRAIVRDPAAFLFDEPLSNLDAKLRVKTRVEIRDLQQRLGTTSIYVTHDQQEAMTLADRLVVMNAGRIEQIGPPMEVYSQPASLFVAGFIGSPPMNILSPGAGAVLAEAVGLDCLAGRALVGVRPEALYAEPDGPLTMTVRVVERLGATANVHGLLDDGETEVIASLAGNELPGPGDTLHLGVDPAHLHLFSRADGQRLT
ncbi:sn-glycerol-3-phosphate ABC transporter ATP-binding protein UgpC [Dichotomicrobium thermohalophilum]|uniref:Carbohydrate ABC transporter ATP-binding protein (CUT1 family) n=1 Tax=Dichotomicrobium thermohalophilum TaxID=933063 RepID=A0A397Q4E2_9HYPH|nr:sn-glycerol-3-phosphate ABC transporter ATP-binding protein UgpC [Dichotomicrobium thermohalophilum]RIA55803.1 carbohydrate ABC transporter ATP-binding protein (CUT1 family) [Dichotomicrobium thermohalophilum]